MRSVISTAGIVMVASVIQVDRISIHRSLRSAYASELADGQDRVAGIVSAARKALGGEDKVAGLKGLTAEGPFRRTMGGRDMEGTLNGHDRAARQDETRRRNADGRHGRRPDDRTHVGAERHHRVGRHRQSRRHGRRHADRDARTW